MSRRATHGAHETLLSITTAPDTNIELAHGLARVLGHTSSHKGQHSFCNMIVKNKLMITHATDSTRYI